MDPDLNVWISVAAAVCGGLAGLAVTALIRSVRARRRLGERLAAARREVSDAQALNAALTGELRHLAGVRLPTLVDDIAREQRSVHVPGLKYAELRGTPAGDAHEAVVRLVGEAVGGVRQSVSRAVLASLRDMLDEPQTMLAATQKRLLTEMDRQSDASSYVEGLMGLDHLVTRCLHGVQRMRILAGSWPGVQRANCQMSDVVEGARGRIDAYGRVAYSYEPATGKVWLEGRIAEPLAVAVTELMSNAVGYSDGRVDVFVQQVQDGYCIVIDDAGVGMNAFQRDEAAAVLTQSQVLDVTTLPDSVQLGFAVIGRLCNEYGFTADVSSVSPFGGVRAVLRLPHRLLADGPNEILTEPETSTTTPERPRPDDISRGTAASGADQLPQRRRRTRAAQPAAQPVAQAPVMDAPLDPDAATAGLANIVDALRTAEGDQSHE
ncbi:histidine kinase [Streptomyces sp. B6B3]|uniref:histidine kinase n=1 Tax=Streptomyces sp. B6B3 TaxID=3153570 RepID=UPI00325F7C56